MRMHFRRPIAALMGVMMLHSTLGPAVQAATVMPPAPAETLTTYRDDGRVDARFAGDALSNRVLAFAAGFRAVAPGEIARIRALLHQYAKGSRRGTSSVEMSLQLLHAFEAPTNSEYHRRVQRLPIVVTKTAARDALGRNGVRTDYVLRGVLKASRFRVDDSNDHNEPAYGAGGAATESGPSPMEDVPGVTVPAAREDCQFDDPEGGTIVGVCATESDVDDAYTAAVALDSDASAIQSEVDAEYSAFCQASPHSCQGEQESAAAGGPAPDASALNCAGQGFAFTGAAINYGWRAFRLWSIVGAVNPPLMVVGEAVILGVVALAAIVGTAIALRDCIRAT